VGSTQRDGIEPGQSHQSENLKNGRLLAGGGSGRIIPFVPGRRWAAQGEKMESSDYDWTKVGPPALSDTGLEAMNEAFVPTIKVPSEVQSMESVRPELVQWLWPGRIALGKITLIAGDPGLGKSYLTIDIAARVTRGAAWPGTKAKSPKGGVLLLSAEDDPADTIRPRLDAAGADCSRVSFLDRSDLSVGNSAVMRRILEAIPGCRLIVVDPITAFLGRTDSHKNADVRAVLRPLADVAREYNCAVIGVTHLNKGSGPAIYRATGSLAFVAASRSVFVVVQDDEDPEARLLLPIKNNLAKPADPVRFRLTNEKNPKVKWEKCDEDLVVDDVLGRVEDMTTTAFNEACDWLRATLREGPVPVKDLTRLAKENGHSWMTVRRAKDLTGVKVRRRGFGSNANWSWILKGDPTP